MTEFKRDHHKYLVIKRTDFNTVCAMLPEEFRRYFAAVQNIVDMHRKARGAGILDCVVVESDWPEYEPVWKLIEDRVTHPEKPVAMFSDNELRTMAHWFNIIHETQHCRGLLGEDDYNLVKKLLELVGQHVPAYVSRGNDDG